MANMGLTTKQITQISYISDQVIKQKFYEIPVADYMRVVVGEGSWSDQILFNLELSSGGDFETGFINQGQSNGQLAKVEAGLDSISVPTITYAKKISWSIPEVSQALLAGRWDVVEAKARALAKNWQLGVQKTAFLGIKGNPLMTGLLNNPKVTNNTTIITKPLSSMTTEEFNDFVSKILGEYNQNSQSSELPNRFIIPQSDYLGLGKAYSDLNSTPRIQILEDGFKKMIGDDFKILRLVYGDKQYNNLGVNRYVLYRDDIETLRMDIPVDFTFSEANTSDGFYTDQVGYGQLTATNIFRPQEVEYFSF